MGKNHRSGDTAVIVITTHPKVRANGTASVRSQRGCSASSTRCSGRSAGSNRVRKQRSEPVWFGLELAGPRRRRPPAHKDSKSGRPDPRRPSASARQRRLGARVLPDLQNRRPDYLKAWWNVSAGIKCRTVRSSQLAHGCGRVRRLGAVTHGGDASPKRARLGIMVIALTDHGYRPHDIR